MDREFSCKTQPQVPMKITAKIERIQPWMSGVDANGELVWEGRAMARWQMEMIRVTPKWFSEFFTRWIEVARFEKTHQEFHTGDTTLAAHRFASQERISEMRLMYPAKKRTKHTVQGD